MEKKRPAKRTLSNYFDIKVVGCKKNKIKIDKNKKR